MTTIQPISPPQVQQPITQNRYNVDVIPQSPLYPNQFQQQYQYEMQRLQQQQERLAELAKERGRQQMKEYESFKPKNEVVQLTEPIDTEAKLKAKTDDFFKDYLQYLHFLGDKWTPTELDTKIVDAGDVISKLNILQEVWQENLVSRPQENKINIDGNVSIEDGVDTDEKPKYKTVKIYDELQKKLLELLKILGDKIDVAGFSGKTLDDASKEKAKSIINAINMGQRFLLCVVRMGFQKLENFKETKVFLKTGESGTIIDMMAMNLLLYLQRKILKKSPKKSIELGSGDDILNQNYFISDPKKQSQIKNRITKNPYASILKNSNSISVTSTGKVKDSKFTRSERMKFIGLSSLFTLTTSLTEPISRGIAILCSMKRYPKAAIESMLFYGVGTVPLEPANVLHSKPSEILFGFYKPSVGAFGINFNQFKKYDTTNDMKDGVFNQYALVAVVEKLKN